MALIFTMSAGLMVGIIEMIVFVVIVDESAIAAIFAATLSAFWRNWIFCASVNVIPVRVAPTIRVFVRFAFVKMALERLALVRLAFVKLKFVRLMFERFTPDKSVLTLSRLIVINNVAVAVFDVYDSLSACVTVIVVLPGATTVTMLPTMVATLVLLLV